MCQTGATVAYPNGSCPPMVAIGPPRLSRIRPLHTVFKMNRDVTDIRNATCFKARILFSIRFSKDQGFPRHETLCITPAGVLCIRLQSPMLFSALPCRICWFNWGEVRNVIKQRMCVYSLLTDTFWRDTISVFTKDYDFRSFPKHSKSFGKFRRSVARL